LTLILGGCLIKNIAIKSGGAQIKVLSDKEEKRPYRETIIELSGPLENKVKAFDQITENIEIFKNGGPIL
jgi:hypothetical protein